MMMLVSHTCRAAINREAPWLTLSTVNASSSNTSATWFAAAISNTSPVATRRDQRVSRVSRRGLIASSGISSSSSRTGTVYRGPTIS